MVTTTYRCTYVGRNGIVGDTEDVKHQKAEGPVSCKFYLNFFLLSEVVLL